MNNKKLTDKEIEIIKALAKASLNTSECARNLIYHRGTIIYHVKQIHKKTGLNPLNFYDMIKLLKILKKG